MVKGAHSVEELNRLAAECFASADFKEGRAAFMEKRPAVFLGR